MFYAFPISDSRTFQFELVNPFVGALETGKLQLHKQCSNFYFKLLQLVTDRYGENPPAVYFLYSNTIILQLYSNQNPVSKIHLRNCKQLKKEDKF